MLLSEKYPYQSNSHPDLNRANSQPIQHGFGAFFDDVGEFDAHADCGEGGDFELGADGFGGDQGAVGDADEAADQEEDNESGQEPRHAVGDGGRASGRARSGSRCVCSRFRAFFACEQSFAFVHVHAPVQDGDADDQEYAHQLEDGRQCDDIVIDELGGGDDLADGLDGAADQSGCPERVAAVEDGAQDRQKDHQRGSSQVDDRDRDAFFLVVGLDDRRDGSDGRGAADCVAGAHQQREAFAEAEVFAEIVGDENRQGHLQDDEDEAFQSG